ncbi:hypothetical protein BI347_01110 [Chromobacterium sphagni]|uniref:Uncharacterized protein n=1 Tax=Chromobacterium sphagni TaxID=1903179 RepID=A0A1S1WYC6_9NEIS|nr:hypothetical protein [Chromobacterium sphagni]OHX12254.1 hypothetical protein BI347_01110 [Chromobacterium sphagni]
MALYLLSLVFFLTDIGARLALRTQSWRTVELTLLTGLLLAWLLYPHLSGWAVPLMPVGQGMLLYAVLVGLQLGLMDAALRTSLERWWTQRQPVRQTRRRHD